MPDIIIYPYGKPVRVKWHSEAMPQDEDIDEIVATYKRTYPQGRAVSAPPRPTGRLPESSIGGRLPEGNITPGGFQPFKIEDAQVRHETTKAPVSDPKVDLMRRAASGDISAAQQLMQLGPKGKPKPPTIKGKDLDTRNPAEKVFEQLRSPEFLKAEAKRKQDEAKRKPITSGVVKVPGIGDITWVQRGPGFEANVPGIGVVKAGNRNDLAKKVNSAIRNQAEQIATRRASPNLTDVVPDENAMPPNVQNPRTSAKQLTDTYGTIRPTDRDKYDAAMRDIENVGSQMGSMLEWVNPASLAAKLTKGLTPEWAQAAANVPSTIAGHVVGGVLTMPAYLGAKLNALQSPEFSAEEKAETVFGLALLAVTSSATPFGPALVDDAAKLLGNSGKFAKALEKMPLEPGQRKAVDDFLKQNPNLTFKGFENGKPKFGVTSDAKPIAPQTPKVEAPKADAKVEPKAVLSGKMEPWEAAGSAEDFKKAQSKWRTQLESNEINTEEFGRRIAEFKVNSAPKGVALSKKKSLLQQYDDGDITGSDLYEELKQKDNLSANEAKAISEYERGYAEFMGQGMRMDDPSEGYMVAALRGEPAKPPTPPKVKTPEKVEAPKPKPPTHPKAEVPKGKEEATGLANQVADREREAGKLGPRIDTSGMSKETIQKAGKELENSGFDIEGQLRKLVSEKRNPNAVEMGAALERKRKLRKQLSDAEKAVDNAIASGTGKDINDARKALERAEANVTAWQDLIDEGKPFWSDAGRGLQIGSTINEGNYAEVIQARERAIGRKLSNREAAAIKSQVEQFKKSVMGKGIPWSDDPDELLRNIEKFGSKNVDRVKAQAALRVATRRPRSARTVEDARRMREEAKARIRKRLVESSAQMGAGPGQAFANLVEAIPEIVEDIKVIVRSIAEEYNIRSLDKKLFDEVRRSLPEMEITDDEIIRVLAGEWDSAVSKEETLYSALAREARKRNAEPLRKAKAELAEDLRKSKAEVREAEKRAEDALKARQKAEGEPALKDANTRLSQAKRNLKKLEDRMETLDDLEDQIKSGGFWESVQNVKKATKEQQLLDLTIKSRRRQIQGMIRARDEAGLYRAFRYGTDLMRSFKLGSDAGMLLRQGLFTMGRGKASLQGLRNFIRSVGDEDAWGAINESYYYKETADGRLLEPIRREAGLLTSDIHLDPEEIRVIQFLKKIPVLSRTVGALERGQSAFINTVRREVFDQYVAKFPDADMKELKARARFINNVTGRSTWKNMHEGFDATARALMVSPRYTASRWGTVAEYIRNPVEAYKSKAARENLKDLGFTAAAVASTLKLAEVMGFDVSWDYTSNDFLKVRRGNTVYDPTAGVGKALRTAIRLGAYMSAQKDATFRQNFKTEVGRVISDSTSPWITTLHSWTNKTNMLGGELDEYERGMWNLAPLWVTGFMEGLSEEGIAQATIDTLPEFFGIGVSRYPGKPNALGLPSKPSDKDNPVLREMDRVGAAFKFQRDSSEDEEAHEKRVAEFVRWSMPKVAAMLNQNQVDYDDIWPADIEPGSSTDKLYARVVKGNKTDYRGALLADKKELIARLKERLWRRYTSVGGPGYESYNYRKALRDAQNEKRVKEQELAGVR